MFENFEVIGRLTRDIEFKELATGAGFYSGSLAVNKRNDQVVYHNITLDKRYGEKLAQYLTKGTQIYVCGTPNLKVWLNSSNQAQGNINISVNKLVLLGSKDKEQGGIQATTTSASIDYDVPF